MYGSSNARTTKRAEKLFLLFAVIFFRVRSGPSAIDNARAQIEQFARARIGLRVQTVETGQL